MESISEERGLALLTADDLKVLSLGISTAGRAEIKMAKQNPNRHIIATTIDEKGLLFTKELIEQRGGVTHKQIELKIEDVSKSMPYADDSFDFVYSRLCLHYIDDKAMKFALKEIHRILKPNKKAFVVVQSLESLKKVKDPVFIKETGMTRYLRSNGVEVRYRRFYSQDDFREAAKESGLEIISMCEYMELTCSDYARQNPESKPSGMLEVVIKKPG